MEGIKGQATLWVLVMTVTLAVAGFSLPSPVLAPLMLDPAQGMLTPEASDWSRKEVSGNDERLLAEMTAKGAKVARPDIGPWRDAVQPVYAKAREKYGNDVDAILADAAAVRKSTPAK